MLVNYVPGEECRVAVTDPEGRLEEFHAERAGAVSVVGNIYVGKVMNVEPSIQAAFVDFGTGVNGFLHVSDLHPKYLSGDGDATERIGKKTPRRERPPIERCLKRGQKILVQVLKEGISTKGPTLTSYLSIPGRFLVMLPDMDKVGVSRKVEDDEERRAMRKVLDTLDLPEDFGFILRTAGMNKTKMELKRDLAYLQRLWKDIEKRLKQGNKPRLLYAESDLLMRVLRDIWTSDIGQIVIDDEGALQRASAFMRIVSPRTPTKLMRYDHAAPIFHAFGIEEQIEMIHAREVPLPSGGSLVFDEAEALIAVDVNSGRSKVSSDAEATAFQTNQEAVDEICRQLRLRDAGGLVMLDLIDMMKRSNRRDIENRMRENLKRDRASTKPLPISDFGIMEMTRQRVRGSMKSIHFMRTTEGDGRGWIRRPESVAMAAMRQLAAILAHDKVAKAELVVSTKVAGEMLSTKRRALTKLELKSGKKIDVRVSESIASDRTVFYAYEDNGNDIEIDRLPRFRFPSDLEEYVPESAAKGEDWAVDAQNEPDDLTSLIEDAEHAAREKAAEEHGVLLDTEGLDELDAEERGQSGDRPKRRRRRGGRGRKPSGEPRDNNDQPRDRSREESHDEESDDQDHPQERTDDRSARKDDHEQGEDGERKRRRRRRRRRGGQREGEPQEQSGESESQGESREERPREERPREDRPREEMSREDRPRAGGRGRGGRSGGRSGGKSEREPSRISSDDAEQRLADDDDDVRIREQERIEREAQKAGDLAPISGFARRGDSWDLEPSVLTLKAYGGTPPKGVKMPEVRNTVIEMASPKAAAEDGDYQRRSLHGAAPESDEPAVKPGSDRPRRVLDAPTREVLAGSGIAGVSAEAKLVKPTRGKGKFGAPAKSRPSVIATTDQNIVVAGQAPPKPKPVSAKSEAAASPSPEQSSPRKTTTKKTTAKKPTTKKAPASKAQAGKASTTKKTTAKKATTKKAPTKKVSKKKVTKKKVTKKTTSK